MVVCAQQVRTGVHAIRLFDFAIVDILISVLAAALIAYFTHMKLWLSILLVAVLGIVAHRMLKVNTKLNTMIFGEL
jgi:energy-converting hydrogenase Eha subunit G